MKEEIWNELYLYLIRLRLEFSKISRNVLARPVMGTIFLVTKWAPLGTVALEGNGVNAASPPANSYLEACSGARPTITIANFLWLETRLLK